MHHHHVSCLRTIIENIIESGDWIFIVIERNIIDRLFLRALSFHMFSDLSSTRMSIAELVNEPIKSRLNLGINPWMSIGAGRGTGGLIFQKYRWKNFSANYFVINPALYFTKPFITWRYFIMFNFNYKNALPVKKFSVLIIILIVRIDDVAKTITKTDNKNRDCLR